MPVYYIGLRNRRWPLEDKIYWAENQEVALFQYIILGLETRGGPLPVYYISLITKGGPFLNIIY